MTKDIIAPRACTRCKIRKTNDHFGKDRNTRHGFQSNCRECRAEIRQTSRRTKIGLIARIYNCEQGCSRLRGHKQPAYSAEELKEWAFSQPLFHDLYNDWSSAGYPRMLSPSVDRIDDDVGYKISNIQLMTWRENESKGHKSLRTGSACIPVNQLTMAGDFVKTWISAHEAARNTTGIQGHITGCCRGKRNHNGGFKWEYA